MLSAPLKYPVPAHSNLSSAKSHPQILLRLVWPCLRKSPHLPLSWRLDHSFHHPKSRLHDHSRAAYGWSEISVRGKAGKKRLSFLRQEAVHPQTAPPFLLRLRYVLSRFPASGRWKGLHFFDRQSVPLPGHGAAPISAKHWRQSFWARQKTRHIPAR